MPKTAILLAAAWCLCFPVASQCTGAEAEFRPGTVAQGGQQWVIRGSGRAVTANATNLTVSIEGAGPAWRTGDSSQGDLIVQTPHGRASLALRDAGLIRLAPFATGYSDGVRMHISGFRHGEHELDLELRLAVALERTTGEVVFEAVAVEKATTVRELAWPRGFVPGLADRTIVPFMQGMLLPRDWPRKVFLYDPIAYGRGLYMPWWGLEKGNSAVMAILETADDGGCRFEHPPGGPTSIEPRWLHSLGKLGYARRLRMCFFPEGNYVDMAARYRRHAIGNGTLVTLKEKIARTPSASGLVGAAVVHTTILSHIQPESSYYNKTNPAANHQLVTFDERADHLRVLHKAGVKRVYVHLDGWGFRGYDNLHPDILPPSPEAGGWEGMRRFADTCEQLGFLFAVHDQYRDFYHDAASYSDDLTVIQEDGTRPFMQIWWGGRQSILCSSFAPGYVRRNHSKMLAERVKLRGAYLDVFAVVPGDECYNPDHRVSRGESLKYRGEAFDVIRDLEGIVSSEEPADWAMRYLHLVHHSPFALDPNPGKGPAMGVPLPLHSLVYHDALVVPWSMSKGDWGIPDEDQGFLHALLNAGVPYVGLQPGPEQLEQVRVVCALHSRLAMQPLVRHEFLSKGFRRQRSTFGDGTSVQVDFDSGKYTITPALTESELQSLSNGK